MGIYFATEKSDVKKESVDNSEGICIEEERKEWIRLVKENERWIMKY